MQNFHGKTPAPCIVNEGILINRTDMLRALETLESVKYTYIVDGDPINQGEGVVVKVFSSPDTATLVVNGCLFLNILSFNYVRFHTQDNGTATLELVEDTRILQLVPIEDEPKRITRISREVFTTSRFDDETPAELFEDGDDDERL
ncbi:MAG TPA: hypothetical protein VGK02_11890 [Candidatus Aquicultor sp.]|jgi:hypothetical protein